jgi:parvulin-like peptidyl-prolyl isomerase
MPKVTAVEQAAAHHLADSLAALIRAGASFDSLARLYSDSNESRVIGPTNRDSLPPGYAEALAQSAKDQFVGPAPLTTDPPERTRWLIARVMDIQPKRLPTFEDVREQVRQRLIEQKGLANHIADLKRQTYVDLRL